MTLRMGRLPKLSKQTCSRALCDCHVEAWDALPHAVDGGIHVESHLLCSDSLSHKLQDNKGVELLSACWEQMIVMMMMMVMVMMMVTVTMAKKMINMKKTQSIN